MNDNDTASGFPAWTFDIPVDIANDGFQLAIYGKDPDSGTWMYWDPPSSSYVEFTSSTSGQDPLIDATPNKGSYTSPVEFDVNLPGSQFLQSGVVVMFIGGSSGIPISSGVPASPTTATNPNDLYSLFEFTYIPDDNGTPTLDLDISNVDQLGFTYTVTSSSAPFPLTQVGSTVPQTEVFRRFGEAFPAGDPFNECLIYGQETIGGSSTQLRLLAPQDVLQEIAPPNAPSFLQPVQSQSGSGSFSSSTYFYLASESSAAGETAPNLVGVFGGFLLDSNGEATANSINVGWQVEGKPVAYTPKNPTATTINLYRASGPAVNAGSPVPPPPTTGYGLLTSMTIDKWNAQASLVFLDEALSVGTQGPKSSSFGFSPLATWFDGPLGDFFDHYATNQFVLYQFNQNNQQSGTLWTGTVVDVTPNRGDPITTQTYIDEDGEAQSIDATWQWGDGTQTYKVLQLVGNAYDPSDFSTTDLSGQSGLMQGEFQGAVVNVYFPYFTDNTGLVSIELPGGETYTLPSAPSWLNNAVNGPSQMVFACAGVFATPNDPDAVAQESTFPVLAVNSLTNLQNVIVSALNRGVATGYDFAVTPQGYTCLFGFSQAPQASSGGTLPAGTYTYYLSGTLNDGSESALSWSQTIVLTEASQVTLEWLPQSTSLYQAANVYRRTNAGSTLELLGTVANTATSQATSFVDSGATPPSPPSNGAPFGFYPFWDDRSNPGFLHSNLFSAFLHQNLSADPTDGVSINGLVYGYPFDDQGNFSTNINYGTSPPKSVTFEITPLTSSSGRAQRSRVLKPPG